MVDYEPGTRVGAYIMNNMYFVFFGFGVYEGKVMPHTVEKDDFFYPIFEYMGGNPKIKLDSGDVIYGYECYWTPEDDMKETIKDLEKNKFKLKFVHGDVNKYREAAELLW
ncbi:MAG: hypothetical protein ACTSRA_00725 [Promethearchaeota archaeon]|nr:MAG: hypothetical protein [Helarchaeota virus Nidhogg Meg22_1012]